MCGRFNLHTSVDGIIQCFLPGMRTEDAFPIAPRYNIAPSQPVVAVFHPTGDAGRQLTRFRWGLLPPWANDLTIGYRMINARSETVAEKRSFSKPFRTQRCVVPANGYYEWKTTEDGKQPFEFSRTNGQLLAIAGLWESNRRADPNGHTIHSCTLLTTAANDMAADVHDRMPVLLDQAGVDTWLDPETQQPETLEPLLKPAPNDWLTIRPVSRRLGNVRNEGPELLEP